MKALCPSLWILSLEKEWRRRGETREGRGIAEERGKRAKGGESESKVEGLKVLL